MDQAGRAPRRLGLAALKKGDLPLAERHLRAALAKDPADAEAGEALAEVALDRALAAGSGLERAAALIRALPPGPKRERLLERLERPLERLREELRRLRDARAPGSREPAARALLARVLRAAPGDARALEAAGSAVFSEASGEARRRRARALLSEAVRLDAGALGPAERFGALMKLGRHREAVAYAESLSGSALEARVLRAFADPWGLDRASERRRALAGLRRSGVPAPWRDFYLADLPGRERERHVDALRRVGARHAWMRAKSGKRALLAGRARQASMCLRAALGARWKDWHTRGLLAEALLCLGRPGAALSEMRRAHDEAPEPERPSALAWLGLLELWLGRYAWARRRFERARDSGDLYAPAWLGACEHLLGRPKKALALLDAALERFPGDVEAYVWRGEVKRVLGRPREALDDLSRARAEPDRPMVWALVNRALAKEALGERRGALREYRAIPPALRARLEEACGQSDPIRRLRRALELARGYRRDDYDQRVWLP